MSTTVIRCADCDKDITNEAKVCGKEVRCIECNYKRK